MSEIEIQKEFSGYLVLTKDGLSSGNVNFNEHLPKMLFESVFLKDATLFSLLSLAKEHKDFFENLISNNIVDNKPPKETEQ